MKRSKRSIGDAAPCSKGRINRLPFALREAVNRKIRDHVRYKLIAAWLTEQCAAELKAAGVEEVNHTHIAGWRLGGYKRWERQQQRLEEMKVQQEFALELARRADGSLQAANLAISASHIYEALETFDIRQLKTKLKKRPELYSLLVEAVSKLSRTGVGERKLQLELTKYQDKVAEQKRKIQEELGKVKGGGLRPETIARIEEALNLL